MATDGPTPQDCHGEAYEGPEVFQTHSIGGSNAVERWVRKIAATSGQLVDWHFAGGCVIVRASARADMDRVRYAIGVHMAEHDAITLRAAVETACFSAPPGRVELPTNGLGNCCDANVRSGNSRYARRGVYRCCTD